MVALSAPNEAAARPLTSTDASGPSSGGPELENEMPPSAHFDEILCIAADGSWTRTVDRSPAG